ncbi:MAG: laccase domain-containing protein [Clostridia bacterium]|nr:laccase domain-containing protein [Clostridia bacterium]
MEMARKRNIKGLIEPNTGNTSVMLEVNSLEVVKNLDPWTSDYIKCDALHVSKSFLKENQFALFGKSADCMMLGLISDQDVYLFHLSVASLNAGLLKHLTLRGINKEYMAIMGPCIGASCYSLTRDRIRSDTSNFKNLGYLEKTYYEEDKLHIDIRGIVEKELAHCGITVAFSDRRCTYCDLSLGSNRRDKQNRHDNVILIW